LFAERETANGIGILGIVVEKAILSIEEFLRGKMHESDSRLEVELALAERIGIEESAGHPDLISELAGESGVAIDSVVIHAAIAMNHMFTEAVEGAKGHKLKRRIIQDAGGLEVGRDHACITGGIDSSINLGGFAGGAGVGARFVVVFVGALATTKDTPVSLPEVGITVEDQRASEIAPF
jgi:hypothetical protein